MKRRNAKRVVERKLVSEDVESIVSPEIEIDDAEETDREHGRLPSR